MGMAMVESLQGSSSFLIHVLCRRVCGTGIRRLLLLLWQVKPATAPELTILQWIFLPCSPFHTLYSDYLLDPIFDISISFFFNPRDSLHVYSFDLIPWILTLQK